MPLVGSILPASLGGVEPRDVSVNKARERRKAAMRAASPSRDVDEATISEAAGINAAETVRSVKGNEDEESREDRQEHAGYTAQGVPQPPPGEHAHIDLRG